MVSATPAGCGLVLGKHPVAMYSTRCAMFTA